MRVFDVDCTQKPIVLLATDAMKIRGAALIFLENGSEVDNMEIAYSELLHINFKETDTAREGVLWTARKYPNHEIRLAVDNTVAAVAMTRKVYNADDEEQWLLDAMTDFLKEQNCSLLTVQVAGTDQAADERSRRMTSDPDKIRFCAQLLMAARTTNWFFDLRKRTR